MKRNEILKQYRSILLAYHVPYIKNGRRDKNSLIFLYWGDTICEHFTINIANLPFIFPHFQLHFHHLGADLSNKKIFLCNFYTTQLFSFQEIDYCKLKTCFRNVCIISVSFRYIRLIL